MCKESVDIISLSKFANVNILIDNQNMSASYNKSVKPLDIPKIKLL